MCSAWMRCPSTERKWLAKGSGQPNATAAQPAPFSSIRRGEHQDLPLGVRRVFVLIGDWHLPPLPTSQPGLGRVTGQALAAKFRVTMPIRFQAQAVDPRGCLPSRGGRARLRVVYEVDLRSGSISHPRRGNIYGMAERFPRKLQRQIWQRLLRRRGIRRWYAKRLIKFIDRSKRKQRHLAGDLSRIDRMTKGLPKPKRLDLVTKLLEPMNEQQLGRRDRRAAARQQRTSGTSSTKRRTGRR